MRRPVRQLVIACAWIGVAFLAGCGTRFDLPTETANNRAIPTDGSYQMIATWSGMDGIRDLLLTQGSGTQLFLLFNWGGTGPGPRGEVRLYALSRPSPIPGVSFATLFNPVQICLGGDGGSSTANRLFVLDQGDTCLARSNPSTGTCTAGGGFNGRVTNLEYYWRVREYGLLGGDTLSSFTDTTMVFVHGVGADARGRVYVAGTTVVYLPSQVDPRLRFRVFQYRINRYARGPRYAGVTPADRNMPGANWHRDSTWVIEEGSGIGSVNDPRGLQWTAAGGGGLYAADFAKNWMQRLSDVQSTSGLFYADGAASGLPMLAPTDVAVDLSGFSYVTDNGHQRVLRFDPGGNYVQRVDVEPNTAGLPLLDPIALTADDSLVYVADRGRKEVVRYKRRP